jgi:predicted phosphodiesterase
MPPNNHGPVSTVRLGIVAGIHEDATSLREAFTVLQGKSCDQIACLGDIVGFSVPYYRHPATRDAHEAIRLVRDNCAYAVVGNHDCFHVRQIPQHSSFSYPDDWYDLEVAERHRASRGRVFVYDDDLPADLSAEDSAFLRKLPEYIVIIAGDRRILVSHYAYPNLLGDQTTFDVGSDGIDPHLEFMRAHGAEIALFSHDLEAGVRIFTDGNVSRRSYGLYPFPPLPFALNGPWIARGTEPNGTMLLDTVAQTIEVLPL